eukprot:CAMPEP_0175066456 /NCGR_PEP_ID=MMETSP0052_2-20121109/16521_1 /TAXON_ID=51329 ORGANISM="Polytomella parva, Strain SAG 63-3" /NCGR_SAMPLE_ID=MMETSP0052_2 /ASSEMBLY_ACC=CAM_ASM_000194 /LENGTH=785 /DNA_ID=CAMNT_0016333165 /DNA_START=42 /DNA_END=2396 /DNA_ORIENTATION=-
MNVSTTLLAKLQYKLENIRNLCILAHVDHGKTTLSDHLIGSNGLIHPRMMGELRYLDSREDEQARGITMKSSSISLLYVPGASTRSDGPRSVLDEEKLSKGFLVNLIDSPGHVDFCSEVSTAARLSDGALIIVDAVEGVCVQTHAVLRQAWQEKVRPCLVINKIDRLATEIQLTPGEAALRFHQIVTHCNMIWSGFESEQFMREADSLLAQPITTTTNSSSEAESGGADDSSSGGMNGQGYGHTDSKSNISPPSSSSSSSAAAGNAAGNAAAEQDMFDPVRGNVCFGSAADGWAFRLEQFAEMYAEKLSCKKEALVKVLWGDYQFNPKDKSVTRCKRRVAGGPPPKTLFVQFALEPIWKAYGSLDSGAEEAAAVLGAIVRGRGLAVPKKTLEQSDLKQALRAVFRAWLPLAEAVLGMAVQQLPSPCAAAPTRIPHLFAESNEFVASSSATHQLARQVVLSQALAGLDSVEDEGEGEEGEEGDEGKKGECGEKEDENTANENENDKNRENKRSNTTSRNEGNSEDEAAYRDPIQRKACLLKRYRSALHASSSAVDAPLVIYISKMVAVPASLVPRATADPDSGSRFFTLPSPESESTVSRRGGGGGGGGGGAEDEKEVFLAFGRVFSGVARPGTRVHVLSTAYDPLDPTSHRQTVVLGSLFMMMGRALERLDCVPAGCVLAVAGLDACILKNATLASCPLLPPMTPMKFQAAPIVKVAVEPVAPQDMLALEKGLRLLNRADPFVEVGVLATGEHVLGAAGEVHLETCVKDLKERFAKVEILVSPPL